MPIKPSASEIARVVAENRATFRRAGVSAKGSKPLTREEVAKLNAALRDVRSEAARRMKKPKK